MMMERKRSNVFGQTMMLATAVSSSMVMKMTPLADPGCWRTVTRPETLTRAPDGCTRSSSLRMMPRRAGARPEMAEAGVAGCRVLQDASAVLFRQSLDLAKTQPQRVGGADVARHVAVERVHARGCVRAGLERGVPVGMVDVDRAHFDTMLAQVAHDLRRRIEAHGLGIEQRRREHVRVAALEPGRRVNEEREARRVAFREAVFAEALDLAEAALGEVARIVFRHHSFDHLGLDRANRPGALDVPPGAPPL